MHHVLIAYKREANARANLLICAVFITRTHNTGTKVKAQAKMKAPSVTRRLKSHLIFLTYFKIVAFYHDLHRGTYAHMSSAFNLNGCFVLQRNDVSKALCKRVRGTYMSAHVLLNLLNELRKRDNM